MYPWKGALSWAESTQLQIDALGLITILGVDEVNISVGRLVSSRYVEFLPLLGAFVLAGNHFTKKQPNFVLYNLTEGVMTTELAGWFSRWLKAQDFHQIHHRIQWEARDLRGSTAPTWTALAVSVPCNGIMVALTVLSADWWGFVNVFAMVASVAVRVVLVRENQAGIDRAIQQGFKEPKNKGQLAKVIVVTDDSKVITMKIPRVLVGRIFTQTPQVPHPIAYECSRWIGWVAFGVQIISLGMASLLTQTCTVVLIVLSTVLTVFKFGCDDRRLRTSIIDATGKQKHSSEFQENIITRCSISPALTAICSEYPDDDDGWFQRDNENNSSESDEHSRSRANEENSPPGLHSDVEAQHKNYSPIASGLERLRRRQDLFTWMGLSKSELVLMENWNLVPRFQNEDWWKEFDEKCNRLPKR
ncbi:hypothetical protein FPOA_13073 [Fusarium poae]|nr:hypothetical protein FPOA_13073 [Fusarium poae]